MRNLFRRFSYRLDFDDMAPTSMPPLRQDRFTDTTASSVSGADFIADVEVHWRGGAESDLPAMRSMIRKYLTRVTADHPVTACQQLTDHMNARLDQSWTLPGTDLTVEHTHIRLSASAEALAVTRAWEEMQRQDALDDLSWRRELRRLTWLRDEIFSQPDMARMYWHVKHPGDLATLGTRAFEEIAAALGGSAVTPRSAPEENPVAVLIGEFVRDLDPAERDHLIGQLDKVFRSFDRGDLADRLPARDAGPPEAVA